MVSQHYTLSPEYYDHIYHWKDYKKEANKIMKIIDKNSSTKGKELLEVGCGTGSHFEYFKKSIIVLELT